MKKRLDALADFVFGYPNVGKPPERVIAAIEQQQTDSERLITICQFLIILTFTVLYFLAPKPQDQDMLHSTTLKILGTYVLFNSLRLYLCTKGRIPAWFLSLSVIADIALLMLLIWGFHTEYRQPPGFYLKAPTLLYAFIFIALRSLRFDVSYLLLAGASAAIGWLILVYYAIAFDASGNAITRSYVEYITSNKVLRGAEFDKVIAILVTTGIIALAITRARRLLIFAARQNTAANELKRFFTPEIAREISTSDSELRPGQGVVRNAAILNVDISGFTAYAATHEPDAVMKLLADYQSRIVQVINANNGRIDKFLGDGILASFGVNNPDKKCACNAIQTIHDIRSAADAWAEERRALGMTPVSLRVAVTVGPVIFGVVGSPNRLEYTVIGDPVNLCAKLEKHCKREDCFGLATLAAIEAATTQGYLRAGRLEVRHGRHVDGVGNALDLVVVEP